ncbi:hypothetical protein AAHE18_01G229400 [Arachis hypogaea]
MPGLDRSLVEHLLALKPNARPVKQTPRRFALEINEKIKEEIECLIKAKFIRTARYVEVCIDFRDLNNATPIDENFMPIADMLIDVAAGNQILSFMDSYSGYYQIFIAEDDVSKTDFRCSGALGTRKLFGFCLFAPLVKLKNDSQFEWTTEHQSVFDSIKAYLSKAPILENVRPHEPLKLYIAALEYTIGCMLVQDDENGYERTVYYLSRVLTDIKTRYSPIEKLCLSLYYTYMKLKCYMVAKSVKVMAQTDLIKYMLSFPMLRGRLGKWMLALTKFDLQYVPAKTVKGQVIADFLVDSSKDLNDQGTNLYFDGSKHKDGAGVRILIISPEEIPSEFLFELKYPCSNNMTKYEALILSLEILIGKGALEVQILGDSQLVLKQLSKEFKCNNEMLQKYLITAWEIQNKIANELVQIASRYRIGLETLKKLASVHQILVPANEREVLCIDEWESTDWRKPISQYLKDPNVSVERKIKLQAMNFVIMAYELYKKGINGSLLRCLGQDDQNVALGEVHNGICCAHQAEKKKKLVLYRNHVYWPSMIKDCIDYAKACQECQKYGSIQQILASELHSIIKLWPFRGWALDLIGLIHSSSSKQHKFILEHIIHRFGISQTLSTDQGTMFTGQRIKNFAASRSINMITSTPYYAQANGQVEPANKILISLIKNHIGNKPRTLHETLCQVLWAYRNSPRGLTGTSPYKLVYGHVVVLPLEINLNTLRVSKESNLPVDDYWNAMFDELNELDSERILALENIIRQKESIARSYNCRIKEKSFSIDELVLKVILPMEKKLKFLGKWSHAWEGPFQVIGTYSGNAYQIKDIESEKRYCCWLN